jgi:hypothetical protein
MAVAKFITSTKLFEYLDTEVMSALRSHGILSLFNYAWLNEDDPDPEFIGLAKWSLDGLHAIFQPERNDNFYSQIQFESLLTICDDLEALMEVSRLAIGNALWMADMVKADAFDHNHHFWLNHINSMTLLGMASDRVRDLFLLIAFDESFKNYLKSRKGPNRRIGELEPNHYQYPFHDAFSLPKMERYGLQLTALQALAKAIYEQRDARNDTVHEVATQAGIRTKMWFRNNEGVASSRFNNSFSVINDSWTKAQEAHLHTIDNSLAAVSDWYLNLVRATSHIFDIEHSLRVGTIIRTT